MRRASSRAVGTFRPQAAGFHVLWLSGPVWVTGPSRRCGVTTSSMTFAVGWAMATVTLWALVRTET
eukprot:8736056-Alexandrium_andersonii.AAC.1